MIRHKTTLVLGAGASKPYGLPTGPELRTKILETIRNRDGKEMGLFEELGFPESDCQRFYTHFRAGAHSIDAFLEDKPQFLKIGRTAIALALIPCEQEDAVLAADPRRSPWYDLLLQALRPPSRFEGNQLRIVTFNYDRSLEFALFNYLKYSRDVEGVVTRDGMPDNEVAALLQAVPIVHVYGQLAPLPWQGPPPTLKHGFRVRAYEPELTASQVELARDGIQLISERHDDAASRNFTAAQEYLAEADRIYFVGFSYDADNMKRLGSLGEPNHRRFVKGTAYGMGTAQREKVTKQWPIELFRSDARQFFTEDFQLD